MGPIAKKKAVARASVLEHKQAPSFIPEHWRFVFHSASISVAGLLAFLIPKLVGHALLAFVLALFAWYEFVRCRPAFQQRLKRWRWRTLWWGPFSVWVCTKILVRPHEHGTRTSSLDFLAALAIINLVCPPSIVATACFVTAWSDPLARVVGKNWGVRRWPRSQKTLAGSFACFLVAAGVVLCCLAASWPPRQGIQLAASLAQFATPDVTLSILIAAVVGLVTMIAELIPQYPTKPKPGDMLSPADNFWLMLASGVTLMLATSFLQ